MCRLKKLNSLETHAYYRNHMRRLKQPDQKFVRDFLAETQKVDRNTLALRVNRLWLDQAERPKNHALMWEILSVVVSMPD